MAEVKTQWERLQHRFKDNWLGVGVSLLLAVSVGASQIDAFINSATSMWEKLVQPSSSQQSASLLIQEVKVRPLPQYERDVASAGPDTVFPVGATVRFDVRHDHRGEEELRVGSLDVKVEAYEREAECPFSLSGDAIHGGAEPLPLRFDVFMADGQVAAVERRRGSNGPVSKGRSSNLLEIEPDYPLSVLKSGEAVSLGVETVNVEFIVQDPALYKLNLSARYTNLEGPRTVEIASVMICRPKE